MIFGIPILVILLMSAYLAGRASEKVLNTGRLSKNTSQIIFTALALFYLIGFFPSLEVISESPVKAATKLSKIIIGKTPEELIGQ
jgi:hypothetical protein